MSDNAATPIISKEEADELQEQIRELVIARIRTLSDNVSLSVGGEDLKRDELIEHVQKEDEIGKNLIDMQIEFLQDMASGALYENK